ALQVNGVPADSVSQTDARTLTFHYATSPVTALGGQSMQMAAGALRAAGTGELLQAFSGVFRLVSASGIIGWWPGDGGPNDISGYGNSAVPLNDTTYAAGLVGQAFSFDGADDGLTVSGSANVQGARTIEAWVFPHANTGLGLP